MRSRFSETECDTCYTSKCLLGFSKADDNLFLLSADRIFAQTDDD